MGKYIMFYYSYKASPVWIVVRSANYVGSSANQVGDQ